MSPKAQKILYWSLTILLVVFMLMDGIAGVMRVKDGQKSMQLLGYPIYLLTILGVAKILGAIAILQPRFWTIKEWAYAGFTISFIGAAASWAFVGNVGFVFPPLVMLVVMFCSYFLWKRVRQVPIAERFDSVVDAS